LFDGSFSLVGGTGLPTIQATVDAPPVSTAPTAEKGMRGAGGYGIWSAALLAGLRANAPGAWSANRLNQANHFIGVAFTAISAMCDGVSSATLEVTDLDAEEEIRSHIHVQKSISHTNREGVRVPFDHELVQLLEDPNPGDTFQDLLYETTLQLCLTGNCLTWMVPNRLGLPSELYVIPTALAQPVPYSQAWPRGAWRITPLYPYGPFAVIPTPVATAGAVVPNEDILHIKRKHPLLRWDGYSPLTAGARQMDILDMIDDARWAAFESGINPSIVFEIDAQKAGSNFNQDQLDKFQAKLNEKYSATKNFGKGMILAPGVSAHPYSTAPVDMAFDGGWEQMRDFVLSLFGVPKGLVGITEATSYAALYAALKQFYLIKLKPEADRIAAQWTKFLARRFSRSIRISLPLPALDDPNLLESQLSNDDKIGMRTVDERRAMRGLQPFGDERGEKLVGGGESGAFGDEPNPMAADPDNTGGTNSHPKTTATPVTDRRDEADNNRPDNEAGRHSLPGMAGKKSYRKASTTQFNLWGDALTRVQAIGKRIDPADLIELTNLSHITVCYGLQADAAALADAVRGFGPVTVRLGAVTVFENNGNPTSVASPDAPVQIEPNPCDILKVDVHSDSLMELNRLLRDKFPYNDQYEFSPHVSIAKIIPGLGEIYAGSIELSDIELTFTHFLLLSQDGHASIIPLAAPRLAVQKAIAHKNGKTKTLLPTDDLTPPPGTRPRRRKMDYPPPNAKPYPPSSSPLPPPSPEGTAQELSSPFWSPTEFEWKLFQQWALALDSNQFPSVHNLAQLGWAKNPALVSAELMGGMGAHHVVSTALEAAIYGLIDLCEANGNAHSVYVTPGPGDNPGPALVTDQKAYRPRRRKTTKDDSGHEHDTGTGQFSTTDTSPSPDGSESAPASPPPSDSPKDLHQSKYAAAETAWNEWETRSEDRRKIRDEVEETDPSSDGILSADDADLIVGDFQNFNSDIRDSLSSVVADPVEAQADYDEKLAHYQQQQARGGVSPNQLAMDEHMMNHAKIVLRESLDYESTKADLKSPNDLANSLVVPAREKFAATVEKLRSLGANDGEIGKVQAAVQKFDETVTRGSAAYIASAEKLKAARDAFDEASKAYSDAEAAEPQEPIDAGPPEEPDDPVYPPDVIAPESPPELNSNDYGTAEEYEQAKADREAKIEQSWAEHDAQAAEWDTASAKIESDYKEKVAAWESQIAEGDTAFTSAVAAYEKDYARWEKNIPKLEAAKNKAEDRLSKEGDRFDDVSEKFVNDFYSRRDKVEDAYKSSLDAISSRLDAADEADPEPDLPEEPEHTKAVNHIWAGYNPSRQKTVKDSSGHEHDEGTGQFSTTDTGKHGESDSPAGGDNSKGSSESFKADSAKLLEQLNETGDHEMVLAHLDNAFTDATDRAEHQVDGVEDHYLDHWAHTRSPAVIERSSELLDQFYDNNRSDLADLQQHYETYYNAVADAIESHRELGEVGEEEQDALSTASDNLTAASAKLRDEMVTNARRVEKEMDVTEAEVKREWLDTAAANAEILNENYPDDPQGAEEDAASYNTELEEAGNPYRLTKDESGQWWFDEIEDEPRRKSLPPKKPFPATRLMSILRRKYNLSPAVRRAAINPNLLAGGLGTPKRIEIDRGADGLIKGYNISGT
jgi:phage portal protein BeeE